MPKQSQSASQLIRNQSKVGDIQQKSTTSLINHSFPTTSKSMDLSSLKTNQLNALNETDSEEKSPLKICLREKKRERQNSSNTTSSDKERWRSSTTILDSLYKDLSKSILTIDDVSV